MKTLILSGIVGQEITEQTVVDMLPEDLSEDVTIEMNSPGGDYFVGLSIYNKLTERTGRIIVDIMGMAASAMALIAMAADSENRKMRPGSRFMIHKPMSGVFGNSDDMDRKSEEMKKMNDDVEKIFSSRMGLSVDKIKKMMDDEKLITPQEAQRMGFAVAVKGREGKIKNYFKNLMQHGYELPVVYSQLPDEYEPNKVFSDVEFTTEPWKPGTKSDKVVNVNRLRYEVALENKEDSKKLIDQFKAQNPHFKELSKIELIYNYKGKPQTFLFTESEIKMNSEIMKELGVENLEEAIDAIKALKEKHEAGDNTKSDDELVARLQAQNKELQESNKKLNADMEKLSSAVEALTDEIKNNTKFAEEQKLSKRDEEIEALKKTGYMADAEAEKAIKFWEADKVTGGNTYSMYVDDLKAHDPRYATLLKAQGSEGDEEPEFSFSETKGTSVAQKVSMKIEQLKKENKGWKTSDALVELEKTEPELMNRYNNGE